MESAQDWQRDDVAKPLRYAMLRRVLAKRKMSSNPIVVSGVGGQDATQVCLPKYDADSVKVSCYRADVNGAIRRYRWGVLHIAVREHPLFRAVSVYCVEPSAETAAGRPNSDVNCSVGTNHWRRVDWTYGSSARKHPLLGAVRIDRVYVPLVGTISSVLTGADITITVSNFSLSRRFINASGLV